MMKLLKRETSAFPNLQFDFPELFHLEHNLRHQHKSRTPAINVIETENSFEVEVATPGLTKDGIHITVENGILSISCDEEQKEEFENYTCQEFSIGCFERHFSLPKNVDEEQVEAKYEDGILKLVLKKIPATLKAKEIFIA